MFNNGCMWKNKDLATVPGFTLVELTIVMILSSILMVLLFTGYNQVQRSVVQYRERQTTWTAWDGFRSQLAYDWHSSQMITQPSPNELLFSAQNRKVRYGWHDKGWWRRQGLLMDSVELNCPAPQMQVVDGVVAQLMLECNIQQSRLPVLLTKPYQLTDPINQLIP
ncbi:MAG TPA: hypothetical protein DCP28_09810 [Cytophagales bacterium]|nr:hypothetical protein [Cytophagales bacterium]